MKRVLTQYPVTFGLSFSWVIVFALMAWVRQGPEPTAGGLFVGSFIQTTTSHTFGDLTARELYSGQLWRTVTATFVHFNLLHLLLNLIGLVQLGRLIESWYGSAQFLAIYVLIAGLGNFGAAALRPIVGDDPLAASIHSGGGSTVVLGLIGLVTVVGWRSPSEFPKGMRFWTMIILLFNAILGLLIPNIDNLGHACGALVGAVIGRADRYLLEALQRPLARRAGLVALAVLIVSAGMMIQHGRAEAKAQSLVERRQRVLQELVLLELIYRQLAFPQQVVLPKPPNLLRLPPLILSPDPEFISRRQDALRAMLQRLDQFDHQLDQGPTAEHYRAWRDLAQKALKRTPTPRDWNAFQNHLRPLAQRANQEWDQAQLAWSQLRYPSPRILAGVLNQVVRK